jgi:hypothetical protein
MRYADAAAQKEMPHHKGQGEQSKTHFTANSSVSIPRVQGADRLLNRIERVLVLLLNASTRSGLALLSVGGVLLIGGAK